MQRGLCVLSVCLLHTTICCAKTAEPIEIQFGMFWMCTRMVKKEPCIRWGLYAWIPYGKGQFYGHLPAHYEVYGIFGMSQSYMLGGSSDVVFC